MTDKKLEAFNKVQFNLLFDSSVKTLMQYNIIMKYEDTDTKTKVFTDQEIPKKPSGCQVRYLLRISYIRKQTCAIFKEVIKIEKKKKSAKTNKENIYWMEPKVFLSI